MAASTPAPAQAEADTAKVAADAVAAAKEAAATEAAKVEAVAEPEVEKVWVAVKTFTARHLTQLLHFEKGDEVTHDIGSALAAKGAPFRPVE